MYIGVDVGNYSAKLVALSRDRGNFKLVGISEKFLFDLDEKERYNLTQYWIAENMKIFKGPITINVPARDINLQHAISPALKPEIYHKIMQEEIQSKIPSLDEFVVDYCPLQKFKRDPSLMYVSSYGVARKQTIDNQIKLLTEIGVGVNDVIPAPFALFALYKYNLPDQYLPLLIVEIGDKTTNIVFILDNEPCFVRSVSTGASIFTEAVMQNMNKKYKDAEGLKICHGDLRDVKSELNHLLRTPAGHLYGVINSTISYARIQLKNPALAPAKIYICGGGAKLRGFREYLSSVFNTPVEYLQPLSRIDYSQIKSEIDTDTQSFLEFSTATGLAIASATADTPRLSFLPETFKKRKKFFATQFFSILAIAVLLLCMIIITINTNNTRASYRYWLDDFNRKTEKQKKIEEQFSDYENQIHQLTQKCQILERYTDFGLKVMEVLSRLQKIKPAQGIEITEYALQQEKNLMILSGKIDPQTISTVQDVLKKMLELLKDEKKQIYARSKYNAPYFFIEVNFEKKK